MKTMIAFLLVLPLAACGSESNSSETKALSDAQSIDQRPDGKYDVVCRDGRRETVTQADLLANNVCVPTGPTPGFVVLEDRTYNLASYGQNSVLEAFGKGLWEGWMDFKVDAAAEGMIVEDGAGGRFIVTSAQRHFTRLKLPVTIKDWSSSSYGTAKLTEIKAEVTRVYDMAAQSLAGKFNMTSPLPKTLVTTFGEDLSGVQMTFRVDARFYDNFDAGTRCGLIKVVGKDRTEILTSLTASQRLSMKGPISIYSDISCSTSRKLTPENATNDFDIGVSSISLGNPV